MMKTTMAFFISILRATPSYLPSQTDHKFSDYYEGPRLKLSGMTDYISKLAESLNNFF